MGQCLNAVHPAIARRVLNRPGSAGRRDVNTGLTPSCGTVGPLWPPAVAIRRTEIQIGFRVVAQDELSAKDHTVCLVWDYTGGLDLRSLYTPIKSVEGNPGTIDPKILARFGSTPPSTVSARARQLDELCLQPQWVYRWPCGRMSWRRLPRLSDFRFDHGELQNRLLIQSVAVAVGR